MKRTAIILMVLTGFHVIAMPPEKGEDPYTLYVGMAICRTDGNIGESELDSIKESAVKGDSVSAMFLTRNMGLIKGHEDDDSKKWLKVADDNGNPIASMMIADDLVRSDDDTQIKNGILRAKIVAEQGLIEPMGFLIDLYEGSTENLKKYKNDELAAQWREKRALSGTLYQLKIYALKNPNKLPKQELKIWRQAYDLLESKRAKQAPPKISAEAMWLVWAFEKNQQDLLQLLKEHHDFFSGFKYCNL